MSDQERPTPQEIWQAKDTLHEQWKLLPVEHKATTLLVLIYDILNTEEGEWVLGAVHLQYESKESPHQKDKEHPHQPSGSE